MIGAKMAGWDHVTGIELQEKYIEIAKKRLTYWDGKDVRIHKPSQCEADKNQIDLLEFLVGGEQ